MSPASARRRQAGFLIICLGLLTQATALAGLQLPQADGSLLALEQPARRIITLSPHLAELAYAAGAGGTLLATAEYSDYPPEAKKLPRIGDAFRFDLERIMALEPDLVIGWASGNPEAALARLESLGVRVWRTEIRHPNDIATLLIQMAKAAGLPSPPAAREAREKLGRLTADYAGKTPIRYFYQVAQKPLFTLNGEHLVSQGLAICGGQNVFAEESVLAPQISREAVLLADPDVLIAPALPGQPDPLEHWRAWPRLSAVRNQAFILLSADEISRATGRSLDSFLVACRQLDALRNRIPEDPDS
jgi:iron complex transport system substrate-binding protein